MRTCEYCGASIDHRRPQARFCSRDCQVAAWRRSPAYRSTAMQHNGMSATVRLPEDLHRRLVQAAGERDLTVAYLVRCAVGEFLDRLVPAGELRLTR